MYKNIIDKTLKSIRNCCFLLIIVLTGCKSVQNSNFEAKLSFHKSSTDNLSYKSLGIDSLCHYSLTLINNSDTPLLVPKIIDFNISKYLIIPFRIIKYNRKISIYNTDFFTKSVCQYVPTGFIDSAIELEKQRIKLIIDSNKKISPNEINEIYLNRFFTWFYFIGPHQECTVEECYIIPYKQKYKFKISFNNKYKHKYYRKFYKHATRKKDQYDYPTEVMTKIDGYKLFYAKFKSNSLIFRGDKLIRDIPAK